MSLGRSQYYYECHITIEPVIGDRLKELQEAVKEYTFKVASLVMLKENGIDSSVPRKDCFMSAKNVDYNVLYENMILMLDYLKSNSYKIYRYKIENILMDSKIHDILHFL